jgi:hypothetical protein
MRKPPVIAICLLMLAGSEALLGKEHRSREFNGVTTTFTLLNPSLRAQDRLKIRISLLNESIRSVTFRYSEFFLEHIEIFTARGKEVYTKLNAPIAEPIAADIPLKPGQKSERIKEIDLPVFYDLTPGDYYLIFRYDLRDLPYDVAAVYKKKLHSEDWVDWDSKKYWFHIHR